MDASIDVVIPVFGRYDLTTDCLEHLARQTRDHRVIVVDDGSQDNTSEALRRDWPDVTVVRLDFNQGYTKAVNRGVAVSEADYVVLLNNDAQLRPDCLEQLVAPMESDGRVGSVAALLLAPGEATIDSLGITADITLAGFARMQGRPPADALHDGPVLTGPEGTTGAYRRSAWELLGGLDENITAYMEVLDLALRLRTAGWATAQAPTAVGIHLGSASYGRRSATQRRLAGFSRGYLLRRYGVLRRGTAFRTLATETVVVLGDVALSHDLQALAARLSGWRAARGLSKHRRPPADSLDRTISLRQSLALRRQAIHDCD